MLIGCVLYLLTFALYFDTSCGITLPCDRTYLARTGYWCYPCSEGYSKISECVVNDTQDRCARCEDGEYQPNCDNSTQCAHCKLFCHPGQVKIKNCTATSDIVCQCRAGYYWKPDTGKPDEGYCKAHSKCGAGEGFDKIGTPYEDTKCVSCIKGVSYSDNVSLHTCVPCTVCNTTLVTECTATSNTVCGDQVPQRPTKVSTAKNAPTELDGDVVVTIVITSVAVAVLIIAVVITFLICRYKRIRENNGDTEEGKVALSNINTSGVNSREHGCNAAQSGTGVSGKETHKSKNPFSENTSANYTPANDTDSTGKCGKGSLKSNPKLQQSLEPGNDNKAIEPQSYTESITKCIQNNTKTDTVSNQNLSKLHNTISVSGGETLQEEMIQLTGKNEDLSESREVKYVPNDRESLRSGNNTTVSAGLGCDTDTHGQKLTLEFEAIEYDTQSKSYRENTGLSADAAAVTPRSSLQSDVINMQSKYLTSAREGVTNEGMTRDEALGNETGGDSDGDRSGKSNALNEVNKKERVWFELFAFLTNHLKWSNFHMFVMQLAANTNENFLKRVDVKLDHAKEETQSCKNRMYEVMNSWRQETPKATVQDICDALTECQLMLTCEYLTDALTKKRLLDTTNSFYNNMGQHQKTAEKQSGRECVANNDSEIGHQMKELKEHDAGIFC